MKYFLNILFFYVRIIRARFSEGLSLFPAANKTPLKNTLTLLEHQDTLARTALCKINLHTGSLSKHLCLCPVFALK